MSRRNQFGLDPRAYGCPFAAPAGWQTLLTAPNVSRREEHPPITALTSGTDDGGLCDRSGSVEVTRSKWIGQ
jgi:hypothetical protein